MHIICLTFTFLITGMLITAPFSSVCQIILFMTICRQEADSRLAEMKGQTG